MAKFIQYDIDGIFPVLNEYILELDPEKKYDYDKAMDLYKKCKFSETQKTRENFFGIIEEIIYNGFNDNDNTKKISPIAYILIQENKNKKLIKEVIYKYLYENIEIFKMECDIIWEYLNNKGFLTKTKSNLEDFLSYKIEIALKKKQGYAKYIDNAKNKMYRTIKNLIEAGIAKEEENQDLVYIDYYKPNWKLFAYILISNFKEKKITIDKIKKSEIFKLFFISSNSIEDYLRKLRSKSLLLMENRSGLSQIDLTYTNLYEFVKNLD